MRPGESPDQVGGRSIRRGSGSAPTHAQIRLFQEIGRRLDAKGFIAANDGNLSLREPDGTFLLTATGARKGHLDPKEVVRVGRDGRLVYGSRPPSSEAAMHLAIYQTRPDVQAIVHAHPPVATGFSVARQSMDACVLPEIVLTLGSVPVAPYGTPGTLDLGAALEPYVREHDAVLLANHGAVALGPDLEEAYFRMERVEHTARIWLTAHLLGHVESLTGPQVDRLLATDPSRGTAVLPCRPASVPDAPAALDSNAKETPSSGSGEWDLRHLAVLIAQVLESRGVRYSGKE